MGTIPPVSIDRDHVRGAPDGRVTLVEYGDFQCPYCGDAYPVVRALLAEFDWLRFVFRHMPLPDLHPRAPASAAAGAQGRFWDMHDRIGVAAVGALEVAVLDQGHSAVGRAAHVIAVDRDRRDGRQGLVLLARA